MNPIDSAGLDSMLRSVGVPNPFGTPGYGPSFGPIPQLSTMQPGFSMTSGSFFGPQIYSPQNLSFGTSPFGSLLGFGAQSFAAGQGFSYYNRGSNLVDVFQGRSLEAGLRQASESVRGIDEDRLTRAIERGMRAAYGPGSYTAASRATAESVLGPLSAVGLSSLVMPGGSAIDFARNTFIAAQNVRDYTRTSYALGLPNREALSLITRISDFMAPAGLMDPLKTRGLNQSDLGVLASELTGMSLLDFRPPSAADTSSFANKIFGGDVSLTGAEVANLKQTAQTVNVSKQLRDYADVIGTMREILGNKDAPIPLILQQLQQLTGGTLQELSPQAANQLLVRMRELARVSNISMTTMMEVSKAGADMARQMGMRGELGGLIAQNAASSTVVSQTMFPGAFMGRMSPDAEFNARFQLGVRNATSPAMRMSVQSAILLQDIDKSSLTPEQRSVYERIQAGSRSVSWTPRDMSQLVSMFEQIGVGPSRARNALFSDVGVDKFLARNPEYMTAIQRAGMQEPITELSRVTRGIVNGIMRDSGDVVGQALSGSGLTSTAIADLVAKSYRFADTPSGRAAWLRGNGLDLPDQQLNALISSVDRSQPVDALMRRVGVKTTAEFMQLFSENRQVGIEQQQRNVAIAVEGQNILRNANITARGDVLERIVGSLGRGNSTVASMLAGAGFMANSDIQAMFSDAATSRVTDILNQLKNTTDPVATADLHGQLSIALEGIAKTALSIPGLGETEQLQALIGKFRPELVDDSRTVMSLKATDAEKLQAMRNIAGMAGDLTDSEINAATRPLGKSGELLNVRVSTLRDKAKRFNDLLAAYEDAPNETIRDEIKKQLLSKDFQQVFGTSQATYGQLRSQLNTRLRSGGSYSYETAARAYNAIEAKKRELKNAKTPEERAQKLIELQDLIQQNTKVLYEERNGMFTPREEFIRDDAYAGMFKGMSTSEIQEQMRKRRETLSEQRNDVSAILLADPANQEQVDALAGSLPTSGESIDPDALKGGYSFTEEQLAAIREGSVPDRELGTPVGNAMRKAMRVRRSFSRLQAILAASRDKVTPGLISAVRTIATDGDLFKDGKLDPEAIKLLAATDAGSLDDLSNIKSLMDKIGGLDSVADGDKYAQLLAEAAKESKAASDTDKKKSNAMSDAFTVKFVDSATGADLGRAITIEVSPSSREDGRASAENATSVYGSEG